VPELPDHLDIFVRLDGQPLAGAWVELRLPMERKRDYALMAGPTQTTGMLAITREELENQVSVIQLSAFKDYSSLGVWRGELVISPFDAEAIRRAQERARVWDKGLLQAYPADFLTQLDALGRVLATAPGRVLEVSATARGGSAHLSCLSALA
jgi:hypothetical protein